METFDELAVTYQAKEEATDGGPVSLFRVNAAIRFKARVQPVNGALPFSTVCVVTDPNGAQTNVLLTGPTPAPSVFPPAFDYEGFFTPTIPGEYTREWRSQNLDGRDVRKFEVYV